MPDVIVTGLPRAGMTAVAALIDHLPNAVCLSMPPWPGNTSNSADDALPYAKWLCGDFAWKRARLRRGEPVGDYRTEQGLPLLDGMKDPRQARLPSGEPSMVMFTRPDLHDDFILGQAQHALYTSLLPALVELDHFTIVAVIRNPVDLITSWLSLPTHPIGQGKLPIQEQFWTEALQLSHGYSSLDTLDRMIQMYELYLQRYHEAGRHIHVVKYEDVIHAPIAISHLFGLDAPSAAAPMLAALPRVRDSNLSEELRNRLRRVAVYTRFYYPDI